MISKMPPEERLSCIKTLGCIAQLTVGLGGGGQGELKCWTLTLFSSKISRAQDTL